MSCWDNLNHPIGIPPLGLAGTGGRQRAPQCTNRFIDDGEHGPSSRRTPNGVKGTPRPFDSERNFLSPSDDKRKGPFRTPKSVPGVMTNSASKNPYARTCTVHALRRIQAFWIGITPANTSGMVPKTSRPTRSGIRSHCTFGLPAMIGRAPFSDPTESQEFSCNSSFV